MRAQQPSVLRAVWYFNDLIRLTFQVQRIANLKIEIIISQKYSCGYMWQDVLTSKRLSNTFVRLCSPLFGSGHLQNYDGHEIQAYAIGASNL